MKTKNKKWLGGAVVLGLVLMALGCSDGELPPEGATLGGGVVPPPDIKAFTADPTSVQAGGSTTLKWEVNGADKVEITASSSKTNFHYSTATDFKSQTSVSALQETTTFILVATKNPPAEATGGETPAGGMRISKSDTVPATGDTPTTPQPATVQKTVTVTVQGAASALSIDQFYSEAQQTNGESTILHWSVVPTDAQVSITSSASDQPVVVDCTLTTRQSLEQGGQVTTTYPASGCASVQPTQDATYTLTATSGGQSVTKDVAIKVSKAPSVDHFTANGSTALKVSTYPSQVELNWKAIPAIAKVTITANDAAITGLPSSGNAEGSVTVTVSKDTTFSLKASVEGQADATAQVQVTSDLSAINCDQFIVSAPTSPVFAGEKVKISWSIPAGAAAIQSVKVGNSDPVPAAQGSVEVTAKASGYSVQFMTSGGQVLCPKTVNTPTASLDKISSDKAMRVVKDPASATSVYVGLDLDGFNDGIIRVKNYQPAEETMDIKFFGTLQSYDKLAGHLNANFMKNSIKTFPVNAVAKDSAGTMFVASTGAVIYKKADGDWKTLAPLFRFDDHGDYTGSHPTCFGKTQTGRDSGIKGDLVTLGQVCDMVATDDGKFFVATDRGLYVNDDIESYLTAKDDQLWHGKEANNPLYAKVINDVEINGGTVFAAGSMGVYFSIDQGRSWQSLKDGVTAYSVAVLSDASGKQVVVAGIDGGVLVKHDNDDWKNVALSGAVYSVAADPYAKGVVYAGTSSGFYVSRDAGQTFNLVTLEGDTQPSVRSISVLYSADPTQSEAKCYIYLATEQGLLKAYLPEAKVQNPLLDNMNGSQGGQVVGPDPDRNSNSGHPQIMIINPGAFSAAGTVRP